jgi:hypothetical protein
MLMAREPAPVGFQYSGLDVGFYAARSGYVP